MKQEMRIVRPAEKLLISGLSFILLFMIVQDLVPLEPLNDIEAISQDRTIGERMMITSIGVGQFLLLLGAVLFFRGKKYPVWVKLWLIIHQIFIFIGVLIDWWIPYFTGIGAEERVQRYELMFGDTHSFLPVMNGIVPNTFHLAFHFVLLACIVLSIYISTDRIKSRHGEPRIG